MRKKAVIALMLAFSMSQAGVVGSYITPTYVSAEAKSLYFDESDPELLEEVLSEDMVSIGYAIKDGCKYVYEYNGKYYASESAKVDGEEEKYDACVFNKEYSSKQEAEKSAQEIKKGLPVFLNLKVLNLENVSQLSKVKLSIYRGSDKVKTVTLDRLDLVSGVDDSQEDTDNQKSDGKVKVSVKNKTYNEDDMGAESNKVSFSWDLSGDEASTFDIENTDYIIPISSAKGSSATTVSLRNGTYSYSLNTENGRSYTGKFKIANKYTYNKDEKEKTYSNRKEPAPKLTLSKIPKKKYVGESFDLTITSDRKATITFNGKTSDGYVKKSKFNITSNGNYSYTAINESGKETTGTISVNCFKNFKYDRNGFWTGNTIGTDKKSNIIKKLVQTGMYDMRMLVVAGILGVSGVVTLGYRFYKRRKGGSNAKNS